GGNVSMLRRDRLYNEGGKLASAILPKEDFIGAVATTLTEIQANLHAEAKARLDANIRRDVTDLDALAAAFEGRNPGWVEVEWARPTGAALDKVVEWLKGHKLTLRNAPLNAAAAGGACIFTGAAAVE